MYNSVPGKVHSSKLHKADRTSSSQYCCRHWYDYLKRAEMHREFTQELRGDVRKEAIDINDHLDKKLMEVVLLICGFREMHRVPFSLLF